MHVLVAEPNPERAQALRNALVAHGHRVEVVAQGGEALAALARPLSPEVALVEDHLPDMTSLALLQAAQRMGLHVAVLVLGADAAAARWALAAQAGAFDVVATDPDGAYLHTLGARVVAVRDRAREVAMRERLADALASTSAPVILAGRDGVVEHANAAAQRLFGRPGVQLEGTLLAALIVLEAEPSARAEFMRVLQVGGEWAGEVRLAADGATGRPCLATLSPVRRAQGRDEGVVLTLRDLTDRVATEEALREANRRLAEQAARDPLTGLYNRSYFREVLVRELSRAARHDDEASVLMVDLDEFKRVNDSEGHAVGDEVLCEVAGALRDALRDGDVLARYGGDEFCVLLPNTGRGGARTVAARLRQAVGARRLGPEGRIVQHLTIGLATSRDLPTLERGEAPDDSLLRLADRALLAAKAAGGDRVRAHGDAD
ncbi:MAG: diguanylate cyclase [Planctomycetia bacterium]